MGRAAACDIVLEDPYVSREHCTLQPTDTGVWVDATGALNHISVNGQEVQTALLGDGDVVVVGNTSLRVRMPSRDEEATLRLQRVAAPAFYLRRSTRELIDREGTLVAQFSASEYLAFEAIAQRYPHAAQHQELGQAVWGGIGFDQYQLHRLLQRVRQRLGHSGEILENVRGAGYRLRVAVAID